MSRRGSNAGGSSEGSWIPMAAGVTLGVGIVALLYKYLSGNSCVKEPKKSYTCTYQPVYSAVTNVMVSDHRGLYNLQPHEMTAKSLPPPRSKVENVSGCELERSPKKRNQAVEECRLFEEEKEKREKEAAKDCGRPDCHCAD